jgi:glycyl-tRNA synthetase beta chain
MTDLLLEIGVEEIPAGYIDTALPDIERIFSSLLSEARLKYDKIITCATPRRLMLLVSGLPEKQETITKEFAGPKQIASFTPDGKPTEALLGFARRYNTDPKEVRFKNSDKGKIAYVLVTIKGEKTETILEATVKTLIGKLSFPKSMWWENKSITFARPIRYITVMLGKKALKLSITGIPCSNKTYGHHILDNKPIALTSSDFDKYKTALKKSHILVDNSERKDKIKSLIDKSLAKYGGKFRENALLNEVANLVEWPEILECDFESRFLNLPEAVLEAAMKGHQRYFPIRDKSEKLLNKFIVITNGIANALIKAGNERVLRARLTDAEFFWEKDRKIPLSSKIELLKDMAYLGKLGSFYDKTQRVKELSKQIALRLGFNDISAKVERAAELSKADLLTEMVGEFTELQGIMGCEYALVQGEEKEVALAIKEHYMPRTADDDIPRSKAGIVLSLAEKFDNIAACFTINLAPTGSQDPYAIRRQALGIIRIIEENNVALSSIRNIAHIALDGVWKTINALPPKTLPNALTPQQSINNILSFFKDRIINRYQEKSYPYDILQAVISSGFDNPLVVKKRLDALIKLSKESETDWNQLVETVERTYNIQKNSKASGIVNDELLKEPEEKKLREVYIQNEVKIRELINKQDYYAASLEYKKVFSNPVHEFFNKVFVNVDDEAVKNNRILLLKGINKLFSDSIADLSCITTGRITK